MFNLIKGLSLFLTKSDGQVQEVGKLFKFLNEDYNFLYLSFDTNLSHMKYIISGRYLTVNDGNLISTIKDNSFRLDGVVIHIPNKLDYNKIWEGLKLFEHLFIIVICPYNSIMDVIPYDKVVFRQIHTLKDNPKWFEKINLTGPPFYSQKNPKEDRYIFVDSLTDEEFTISSYESSYIRDKKLGILLRKSDNI